MSKIKQIHLAILFAWIALLFVPLQSLRHYYLDEQPPLWDNLAYQIGGLELAHSVFDWTPNTFSSMVGQNTPIGYVACLGFSFFAWGFNATSPYIISALFGVAFLMAAYLLATELGASPWVALSGALFYSILPNFLYQNFLQTRNDYPLAASIGLSWYFLVRSARTKSLKLGFLAGVIAGLGTLIKMSAPGYIIWGVLVLMFVPLDSGFTIKFRIRLLLLYGLGATLACGWHYLPSLSKTLHYYGTWAKMGAWQAAQYQLETPMDRWLFYPRNFLNYHLGVYWSLFYLKVLPQLIVVGTAIRCWQTGVRRFLSDIAELAANKLFLVVLVSSVLPIVYLTVQHSLSSAGDTPILALLLAAVLVVVDRTAPDFKSFGPLRGVAVLAFIAVFPYSAKRIPLEAHYAHDFVPFANKVTEFRSKWNLADQPLIQTFSHPVYNTDSLSWRLLMDFSVRNKEPQKGAPKGVEYMNLLYPEEPAWISHEFEKYPFLISSGESAVDIGGEPFHTFNRLQKGIREELNASGQYVRKDQMKLENGKFTLEFMLNQNHAELDFKGSLLSGKTPWGTPVSLVMMRPGQIVVTATVDEKQDQFFLADSFDKVVVRFHLKKAGPGGICQFESDIVPGSPEPRELQLKAPVQTDATALHMPSAQIQFADFYVMGAKSGDKTNWGDWVELNLQHPVQLRWVARPNQNIPVFNLVPVNGGEKIRFVEVRHFDGDKSSEYRTESTVGANLNGYYTLQPDEGASSTKAADKTAPSAFRFVNAQVVESETEQ